MSIRKKYQKINTLAPGAPYLTVCSAILSALAACMYPIPLLAAWYILNFFDSHNTLQDFPWHLTILVIGAVFLGCAFRASSSYLGHKAAFLLCRGLRFALMKHLGKLPLHWFSTQSTGGLKKIFLEDIGEVEGFVSHSIPDLVYAVIFPLLSITCLMFFNWHLALVLLLLLIVALCVQGYSYKQMAANNVMERHQAALKLLHADAVEFIQGMPEIKLFNRSVESFGRMQKAIDSMHGLEKEACQFYSKQWVRFLASINLPLTLLACIGTALYFSNNIRLPDLVLFIIMGGTSLLPMNRIVRFMHVLMRCIQGWTQVSAILNLPMEKRGSRQCTEMTSAHIQVENLCASYAGTPVLKGISFTAKAHTVTAIVGPSGSGKSTLAAVLAGMENFDSGSIKMGGIELEDFSHGELSKAFSIVYQQPFIFAGTVRENLLLGNEGATQEDMDEAIRMTCCQELIDSLPAGYDTRIGGGGDVHLSGGQKQRLALARMALRNTPIVLLDEATAFADPESEAAIQKSLAAFLSQKTVIVIAHRLPSIANANSIIVLHDGKIAEQGTHTELLAANAIYARLWEAQQTARSWTISTKKEKSLPS